MSVATSEAFVVPCGWWQERQPVYQAPYLLVVASLEWVWMAWQSLHSCEELSRRSRFPSPAAAPTVTGTSAEVVLPLAFEARTWNVYGPAVRLVRAGDGSNTPESTAVPYCGFWT